ncbi:MAG: putative RND superfamily exporter protein [Myxococcota bacterium]
MWTVSSVMRVDSLTNFNWIHAEEDDLFVEPLLVPEDGDALTPEFLASRKKVALEHDTLPGRLVSEDGKTGLIMAQLVPGIDAPSNYEVIVNDVRAALAEFDEAKGDHVFHLIGQPVISNSFRESAMGDLSLLTPIVLLLTVLFLIGIFRRVSGVLLPLVVIGTTVIGSMTLSGWLGFSINNMTAIIPQILLAIAVADAVHVLTTMFRALDKGADRKTAARHALKKNFLPTLVTSISTAVGFLSFSTAAVEPIAQMGIITGLGTLFAWLMTYFVMGPLMVLLPLKEREDASANVDLQTASERGNAIASWLRGNRKPIIVSALVLLAGGSVLLAQTEVNSDPLTYFPEGSELNLASTFMEENLGGAIAIEFVIDSTVEDGWKDPVFLGKAEVFQSYLDGLPWTTSTNSIIDIVKSMHRSFNGDDQAFYTLPDSRAANAQLFLLYTSSLPTGMNVNDRVSLKQDAIRMTAMWNIHDSNRVLAAIQAAEAKGKELGINVEATGKMPIWQRMNPYVVEAFVTSILLAVLLMTLLLIMVFRSFKLGLMAMIPNLAPLIIGGALLVLVGKSLDIGTVIIFSVCLGIAVDDTVHFLSAFHRLTKEGHSPHEAVARIFTHTMPALVFTTIILVVGFGVFVFAQFIPNQFFGIMVAFILSLALLTDAALLPALLLSGKDPDKRTAP